MGSFGNFVKRMCKQTAVYWQCTGSDGRGGYTYGDPQEIKCRWAEKNELVRNNEGEQVVSNAEILTTRTLSSEGMLYKGTLSDLDSSQQDDPETVQGAYKILRTNKIPTIGVNDSINKVYL